MVNPKAAALIKRIEKLNKDVAKCGILAENITPEQEYLFDKVISHLGRTTRGIETAAPVLRLDLLKVFADHLKSAKLIEKLEMGYNGITAELPILFPNEWASGMIEDDRMIGKYLELDCNVGDGVRFFFGLTEKQYYHLFYYYNQNSEWGNIKITGRTGKAKFIENMEQFISYFEKGGRQC